MSLLYTPLSRYFSLEQLIQSDTALEHGIENRPPPQIVDNLRLLAAGLDEVQDLLGHALQISSGYRCPALNEAVGGTARSQHCLGLAADFDCPAYGTPMDVAHALWDSPIRFDQCIMEFGRWVHLSFTPEPRRRILTIYDTEQGYLAGLVDRDGNQIA
ncbi:MAG TPA: D-Ala-D-Ala carboxypeptidase family metallohydrolase [Burkholderiales bacterium]|nr:D-Ala-D-Ala carboxypeptidase family metallohydrolase [Burkholderiales bacterium]